MPMNLAISPLAPARFPDMPSISGVRLATAATGLKYKGRDDLLIVAFDNAATMAGVFTTSATAAAPVLWCRDILAGGRARGLVCNAGNANAFTGMAGRRTVEETAAALARELGCAPEEIFVASTGVIGEPFDAAGLTRHFGRMTKHMASGAAAWEKAARAIMTTDTFPKGAYARARLENTEVTICGIAKGSGMIAPNMATMLAFLFTDAALPASLLQALLQGAVEKSFNCITVDGDTSTNDTVLLAATGTASNGIAALENTQASDPALASFAEALETVCGDLARQIVRDGEGAEKFVTLRVSGAPDTAAAKRIAMSIANSPLVKTAIAGEDPNWGRIVMAVGKAGVPVRQEEIAIAIGGIRITENGAVVPGYDEAPVAAHMKEREIEIAVTVGNGPGEATIWTCDLTHRYIDINADYRS